MKFDDLIPEPKMLEPHQLGWLRRPELDQGDVQVWELPDGKLWAHKKGKPLVLQHLKWPK